MGPLQVGTTLSQKYKIERLLAESGGTVLYEATDTSRKQRVWIKIMQQESLANAAAMARFQREAAGAKVLDVGKNDAGLPYMVATEFGPPERAGAPRPLPPKKKTLPGVAPPPLRIPSKPPKPAPRTAPKEEEEEAAPISGSEIVMVDAATPAPADAGIFSAPPAESNPVLAMPLITTPPIQMSTVPEDIPELDPLPHPEHLPPLVEDPIVELPAATPSEPTMKRKRLAAAPTVFIDRPKERSQTSVWVVALVLASIVTGGAGWYFGHKDTHAIPAAPSATTITTATVTTTTVAAATTTSQPEPMPTLTATPTVTATASATATVTATPTVIATPSPPPKKPPVHKPVPTAAPAHPPSGDPLTL